MIMKQAELTQPKGLSIFFLTEMWERYGFYIIQGLLILFLIQKLNLSDTQSYAILGSFTALAYITPIVGGYLADKTLGHFQAVIAGSIMLCFGYALIAASKSMGLLSMALGIISMGTGLLKPSVSSLLGGFYTENDSRRDSGFTIFYVGINMGILLATCLSGYLVEYFSWRFAFLSASVSLAFAFCIFYWGAKHYHIPRKTPIRSNFKSYFITYITIVVVSLLNAYIIQHEDFALFCFLAVCIATVFIVLYKALQRPRYECNRILAYFILVVVAVFFWAFYFQLFFSLNLFVLRDVSHQILGFTVPTPAFMAIESFGVIIFGIILGKVWTWLKSKPYGPSTAMKFSMGLILISLALGVLLLGLLLTPKNSIVDSYWLVLTYLIIALAELALSPIGLAMVTELIPFRLVGMMMGIWFVSLGIGGKLAGLFADYSAVPNSLHQLSSIKAIYSHAFTIYFFISVGASLLCLALTPIVKRLAETQKPI
jgi:POT family proton-dependent oligopeptide transporter